MQTAAGGAGQPAAKVRWENYDPQAFSEYYWYRPFHVLHRAALILLEMVMLSFWQVTEKDIRRRAAKLRRSLIRLGPFYIKLGQALSTRPDVLPSAYCNELAKLQDRIPPFPTAQAVRYIREQLGASPGQLFAEFSSEPVAAASLGQVYKARLHSGELVAVKVQRPGMLAKLALDAHLLRLVGGRWQKFTGARDIVPVVDEMVGRMFEEVDYVREGKNAERFAMLYGLDEANRKGKGRRATVNPTRRRDAAVKVPKIYWDLSSKSVLTMEWIDGIKLTDKETISRLNLRTQDLVDQGVLCSLKQLLEEGFFHADPHPGNLVVTKEGVLAYFDFGMMSEMRREYRIGLIRTLVHYVNRDAMGLANDFMLLGFLPAESEIEQVAMALQLSLGEEGSTSNTDFQGIMSQLSDVMHKYNFRLPAEYAMVIRALGSLEGTATTLDPDFKVVSSAYPFIVGRLLADPDPAMRQILRELLICTDGSIRWRRLERLVVAIAEEAASVVTESAKEGQAASGRASSAGIRGSFDTRAVVSAANDLLEYVFSPAGVRVRIRLAQDILQAVDSLVANFWHGFTSDEAKQGGASHAWEEQGGTAARDAHSATSESVSESDASKQEGWGRVFAPFGESYWGFAYWRNFWQARLFGVREKPDVQVYQVKSDPADARHKARKSFPRTRRQAAAGSSSPEEFERRLRENLSAFAKAVERAPETWAPLLGIAAKPEARAFFSSLLSAILEIGGGKSLEAAWLLASKKLHDLYC